MNKKKILMILLLIVVIGIIAVIIVNINNKSNEITESKAVAEEETTNTSEIIEVTDNYFIEQTNDMFLNIDDYIDRTVKIEGLIYSYEDYSTGDTLYAVVRNTPGCCGNDGLAGVDIRYDKDYPQENTWVEVVGIIKKDTVAEAEIPAIQVTSLKEKEEGMTFVTN